jgi:erythromycin esterase
MWLEEKWRVLLLACMLVTGLGSQAAFSQDAGLALQLSRLAVRIDPLSADSDFQSMIPIQKILRGRKVVGLGEATHGTHEFFTLKARLIQTMVSNCGFRLFGIEANLTECRKLNEYISTGVGDVGEAIKGMHFWTWNTKEVLDLIEWMRSYNKDRPRSEQIKFYGFDMQFDKEAWLAIRHSLISLDSAYFENNFKIIAATRLYRGGNPPYIKLRPLQADSMRQAIKRLADYTGEYENVLIAKMGLEEVAFLKRNIRLLQQCLDEAVAFATSPAQAAAVRDGYMCENIRWILEHEGSRSGIIIWAHNGHIAKDSKRTRSLGYCLKETFAEKYYAIGFDFNRGGFRALDRNEHTLKSFTVDSSRSGSTGYTFAQTGLPCFFIDIEQSTRVHDSLFNFFNKKMMSRSIGALFDPQNESGYYTMAPLADLYDGLIFVDVTTASIPLIN